MTSISIFTKRSVEYLCHDNPTLCLGEFIMDRRESGKEVGAWGEYKIIWYVTMSHVTCHMSHVTCTSRVTCHMCLGRRKKIFETWTQDKWTKRRNQKKLRWEKPSANCMTITLSDTPSKKSTRSMMCLKSSSHNMEKCFFCNETIISGNWRQCRHLHGSIFLSRDTSVLALHFSSLSRVFWYFAA